MDWWQKLSKNQQESLALLVAGALLLAMFGWYVIPRAIRVFDWRHESMLVRDLERGARPTAHHLTLQGRAATAHVVKATFTRQKSNGQVVDSDSYFLLPVVSDAWSEQEPVAALVMVADVGDAEDDARMRGGTFEGIAVPNLMGEGLNDDELAAFKKSGVRIAEAAVLLDVRPIDNTFELVLATVWLGLTIVVAVAALRLVRTTRAPGD